MEEGFISLVMDRRLLVGFEATGAASIPGLMRHTLPELASEDVEMASSPQFQRSHASTPRNRLARRQDSLQQSRSLGTLVFREPSTASAPRFISIMKTSTHSTPLPHVRKKS